MIKNLPTNAGDMGSIPESGRSPGGGHGTPTPVCLPGKSHGQSSLEGYSPLGHKRAGHDLTTKQQHIVFLTTGTEKSMDGGA